MFFNQYPYINLTDLNLDMVLKELRRMGAELDNFVALNAIKYADPLAWNITSQYGKNTVVIDPNTGTAYISVAPVPAGVNLTDTDYWTVVFDLGSLISITSTNLTFNNARNNVVADFASAVGDWLLWNGTLYKVILPIPIATAYVDGYNLQQYSVEKFVADYITAVMTNIGTLTNLTTTNKSNLVAAINEVNTAAGNAQTTATNAANAAGAAQTTADNAVIAAGNAQTTADNAVTAAANAVTRDTNNIVYQTATNLSIDNTGATDVSSILAGLTDNVGLKAGTYLIATTCTINAQLVFAKGAKLSVNSGVTVTVNGYVNAGLYEIFAGAGTVKLNGNNKIYPEWFGAKMDLTTDDRNAIQKAIDSITRGEIVLQAGKYNYYQNTVPTKGYYVGSTITIDYTKSDIAIVGVNKAVIYSNATIVFNVVGSTNNGAKNFIGNMKFENVIIFYRGTPATPAGYNEKIAIKHHGGIRTRILNCEIYNYLTGIYSDTQVGLYILDCVIHAPNVLYGTCVYLNDNIINNAVYPNASIHLDNNIFFGGSSSVGITGIGAILSDLFVRNNEFGGFYEGISLTATNTPVSAYDIHITDNIMDNVAVGIDIQGAGLDTAAYTIVGNWVAATGSYGILLNSVHNATLADNLIIGALGALSAITFLYCYNISVVGNVIKDSKTGIAAAASEFLSICENAFNASSGFTIDFAIQFNSVTNSNISNNMLYKGGGTITWGIVVPQGGNVINWNKKTAAISNNIVTGNVVDGATI